MTVTYDRVLVPVDGSDGAERATRHALAVAAATGAPLDFVHVVETGGPGALGTLLDPDVVRDRGGTILRTAEALAADVGVETTADLREGRPHEEILERAAECGSDLVVLGERGAGAGGAARRLLGGVTTKVLRAGERPVLVVPRADRVDRARVDPASIEYRRLLLPTDGSKLAAAAVPHAVAVAAGFGSTIHVVSAVDVPAAGRRSDPAGVSDAIVEDLEDQARTAVSAMADRVTDVTDRPVETAVLRGRPSAALRDYVADEGMDLVVMGAHGRSGVRRLVLGSVTDRTLRTVDVPVIVVPGEESGTTARG